MHLEKQNFPQNGIESPLLYVGFQVKINPEEATFY